MDNFIEFFQTGMNRIPFLNSDLLDPYQVKKDPDPKTCSKDKICIVPLFIKCNRAMKYIFLDLI